jgi:alpha-L-fucosidase
MMPTELNPPKPFGAVPSPRQLAWHKLEFYGFIHFTVNTFTNREWGLGNESPAVFQPGDFSADQIAETAALGGMKGLILTAKHHDGFCLWPSEFTNHSVKNSPWKDGKGDVVGDLARACQKQGIRFGVYLSPWDRNHPEYGRPEYVRHYRKQLRELLTRYGTFFEVWFDGANGGDGYYGGKYERRTIDASTYYEWEETFGLIRELQPEAVIFGGMPGADIRWVGNEGGIAGDPCWHTYDAERGEDAGIEQLNQGLRFGNAWFPAECDVSIRPGWFFHQRENRLVRDPRNLLDLYFQSVGRGASLLLNLPPDRRGRIHKQDVASLLGLRDLLERMYAADLAKSARVSASNTRGGLFEYAPGRTVDGQTATYWATDDAVIQAELFLAFDWPVKINLASLREHLPMGQRVDAYALDAWIGGEWQELQRGTAIGNRRLVQFQTVTTERVRLRILQAVACPAIQEISLYFVEDN